MSIPSSPESEKGQKSIQDGSTVPDISVDIIQEKQRVDALVRAKSPQGSKNLIRKEVLARTSVDAVKNLLIAEEVLKAGFLGKFECPSCGFENSYQPKESEIQAADRYRANWMGRPDTKIVSVIKNEEMLKMTLKAVKDYFQLEDVRPFAAYLADNLDIDLEDE